MSKTTLQTSLEDLEKENQKLKEKYNTLVCKLEERLRCPVCLEVPTTGPVYNCLYGHSVCSSCYTGYNSDCPQCRVKMYKITSLLAATVIENIDHTCQHEGCGERLPADPLAFIMTSATSGLSSVQHSNVRVCSLLRVAFSVCCPVTTVQL